MAPRCMRIEDYALIGDCETGALIGRDGSIDWLCWPRFDSGACFAALLGDPEHGRWRIAPAGDGHARRAPLSRRQPDPRDDLRHRERRASPSSTSCRPSGPQSELVRMVVGRARRSRDARRADPSLRLRLARPWVTQSTASGLRAIAGPDMVVLRTPTSRSTARTSPASPTSPSTPARRCSFVLSWRPSHKPVPEPVDATHRAARDGGVLARVVVALHATTASSASRCCARCSRSRRSPTARPAASSPRRRRRFPRRSAASATGTTASAGCATPR